MDAHPRRTIEGPLLVALFLVYLVWGSTYFALRVALETIPPFLLSGTRFLLAGAALYAFLRMRGAPHPALRETVTAGKVGLLLLVVGNGAVAYAEQWVSSSVAAIAVATMPLWAAVFASMWGERPTRPEWLGLAVGMLGVGLLHAGGGLSVSVGGAVVLVIGPLGWALGSVYSRHVRLPPVAMTAAIEMLVAGVTMILIGLALGERLNEIPTVRSLLAWSYLVVFGSLVAFSAFGYLLHHARPALATSYAYVNPVIAVLLGWLLGNETVRPLTWVALAVIVTGVGAISLARGRRRASPPPSAPLDRDVAEEFAPASNREVAAFTSRPPRLPWRHGLHQRAGAHLAGRQRSLARSRQDADRQGARVDARRARAQGQHRGEGRLPQHRRHRARAGGQGRGRALTSARRVR